MNHGQERRLAKQQRAERRLARKVVAQAFWCKGPHPSPSWRERGRLCWFQIVPRKVHKDAMAACPRCGQQHVYDGKSWAPLT